jgi:hypothetical protein
MGVIKQAAQPERESSIARIAAIGPVKTREGVVQLGAQGLSAGASFHAYAKRH